MMRNILSLFFCAIVVAAALGVPVNAGADAPRLTTELIQQVLNAAVAKANAIKVPMGISIVDQGGNLVGFIKMEGTFVHTNYTSFSKAYTAVSVRRATHEMRIPPQIMAEIASTTGGKFTSLPGGFPLLVDGQVIGGIGVGGGDAEEDVAVAGAGATAVK